MSNKIKQNQSSNWSFPYLYICNYTVQASISILPRTCCPFVEREGCTYLHPPVYDAGLTPGSLQVSFLPTIQGADGWSKLKCLSWAKKMLPSTANAERTRIGCSCPMNENWTYPLSCPLNATIAFFLFLSRIPSYTPPFPDVISSYPSAEFAETVTDPWSKKSRNNSSLKLSGFSSSCSSWPCSKANSAP